MKVRNKKFLKKVGMLLLSAGILFIVFSQPKLAESQESNKTNNVNVNINSEPLEEYKDMKLVFNDEFNSEELNKENWNLTTTPENGTHHYANKEGKDENIWLENGELNIQAKKYQGNEDYSSTSGAVSTQNKFDFRYGRVDVRAKIPTETGMWPAIWMMPTNPDYEWPMAGEIDIMELISDQPDKIWSTIHSGVYNTDYYFKSGSTLTNDNGNMSDEYHVYSVDWQPNKISFYVDDQLVTEINDWKNWVVDHDTGDIKERDFPAPFNQDFFLKLNVATGGWSQDVDETTRWGDRTTMKVDYVRVYQEDIQTSNISDLKDMVEHYNDAGDFVNNQVVQALNMHLKALEQFEKENETEKVVKHLNGFKHLLEHQKEKEQISDKGHDALMTGTETLLDKFE